MLGTTVMEHRMEYDIIGGDDHDRASRLLAKRGIRGMDGMHTSLHASLSAFVALRVVWYTGMFW